MAAAPIRIVPASADLSSEEACPFSVEPAGVGVSWSIDPQIGSINEQGVYTAPVKILRGRRLVVVAKGPDSNQLGTAIVTLDDSPHTVLFLGLYGLALSLCIGTAALLLWPLLAAPQQAPMVMVNPPVVTLDPLKDESFAFTATMLGDAKQAVTWSADHGKTIDAAGVYKHAANAAAREETFTVRATSVSDPTRSNTATVHLVPKQHVEVVPQAVSATAGQQVPFRIPGSNSGAAWSLSRSGLGWVSADGTFTAAGGRQRAETVQVNAWSAPPSRIAASAAVVVNPELAGSSAADWRMLALVMVMGSLGSMLYYASSFVSYVGNRTFCSSWFWFYISRPFVGGGLAVIFYFIAGTGLIGAGSGPDLMKVAMISSLVGLFSDKAVKKLSDILDAVLATKDDRKDKMEAQPRATAAAAPKIVSADPATVPRSAASAVRFTGTNLGGVKAKVTAREAAAGNGTATGFTLDLSAEDTAGDKVTIAVTNANGTGSFDLKTA